MFALFPNYAYKGNYQPAVYFDPQELMANKYLDYGGNGFGRNNKSDYSPVSGFEYLYVGNDLDSTVETADFAYPAATSLTENEFLYGFYYFIMDIQEMQIIPATYFCLGIKFDCVELTLLFDTVSFQFKTPYPVSANIQSFVFSAFIRF